MAMLIESVVRHYPIGTLMLLDSHGNDDLGKHSIVGTDSSACQPNHFVIDGQQRLTTFYKLLNPVDRLKPHDPIQYKGSNYKLFYSVGTSLSSALTGDVHKPQFIRPVRTEAHEAADFEGQGRRNLIPLEFLQSERASRLWVQRAYQRRGATSKSAALRNIREIRQRIHRYACPVELIRMKLKPEHHANMFRLLNESGTDLSIFDLLVASLSPLGIELRQLWRRSNREFRNLESFKVQPIYIIQTMLLMKSADDENPSCTKPQVKRIAGLYEDEVRPKQAFERDWNDACRFIDRTIADLKSDFGVAGPKYLPYSPMLVPMAAAKWYVSRYPQRYKGRMKGRLRRWYWGAIFDKAFESSTDTRIGQHFGALVQWLSPRKRSNIPARINFWKPKKDIALVVERVRSSADAVYKALLCLPLVERAEDIYSKGCLDGGERLHDHHIYPKAYLAQANGTEPDDKAAEKINHVANRMLITDKTNLEISKKPPYVYLKGVGGAALRRHFLFPSIVGKQLSFDEFRDRRQKLMVDYVHRLLTE